MFAGSPDGGYIFPAFQPGFDAVMSIAKVLELLALEHKPLSELCAEVPDVGADSPARARAVEPQGPRDARARRARQGPSATSTADGIRVEENGGWAQLVPDPDEPLFHIYAEGPTDDESAALAQRYRALLDEVLDGAGSRRSDV